MSHRYVAPLCRFYKLFFTITPSACSVASTEMSILDKSDAASLHKSRQLAVDVLDRWQKRKASQRVEEHVKTFEKMLENVVIFEREVEAMKQRLSDSETSLDSMKTTAVKFFKGLSKLGSNLKEAGVIVHVPKIPNVLREFVGLKRKAALNVPEESPLKIVKVTSEAVVDEIEPII